MESVPGALRAQGHRSEPVGNAFDRARHRACREAVPCAGISLTIPSDARGWISPIFAPSLISHQHGRAIEMERDHLSNLFEHLCQGPRSVDVFKDAGSPLFKLTMRAQLCLCLNAVGQCNGLAVYLRSSAHCGQRTSAESLQQDSPMRLRT